MRSTSECAAAPSTVIGQRSNATGARPAQAGAKIPSPAARRGASAAGARALGRRERRIVLQGRQAALGEQAHVRLGLVVRQVAERELGDQVLEAGDLLQPAELLQAVVGRADDLDRDVEVGRLLEVRRVLELGVGLRRLAVGLVAFDVGEMAVGEMIVVVDRLPLAPEILAARAPAPPRGSRRRRCWSG